ncbi:uncharacterized protein [Amphiura filiformis]|uniref:uncharacterized protein n=1 Tax=Amphiura filiformis TaxID=82378 RepID=UPI003B20C7F1
MEHGERYAYPILLIKKLIEDNPSSELVIVYDIACKIHSHLLKTKQADIAEAVELVLPCWHAYGHSAACQVLFSTKWVSGCGLTDGEGMERLWAYLRPFSAMTKEMTPAHRIDLLTDALTHYRDMKEHDIIESVQARSEKAEMLAKQAISELHLLLQTECDGLYSQEDVKKWMAEEKNLLAQKAKQKPTMNWKEQYVSKLQLYENLRSMLAVCEGDRVVILNEHCEEMNNELINIELKNDIGTRWQATDPEFLENLGHLEKQQKITLLKKIHQDVAEYSFLQELRRKYSDGQKAASRVSNQISKASRAIDKDVQRNNDTNFKTNDQFPRHISRHDVLNMEHYMFSLLEDQSVGDSVALTTKRKAVQLLRAAHRAIEEEELSRREKASIVGYYTTKLNEITEYLEQQEQQVEEDVSLHDVGFKCLLLQRCNKLQNRVSRAHQIFSEFGSPEYIVMYE